MAKTKKPQNQEGGGGGGGGESSNSPVQEKEATAKQGSPNLPAVLFQDHELEQYHLLRLPAGDQIDTRDKPEAARTHVLIGCAAEGGWLIYYQFFTLQNVVVRGHENVVLAFNYIYLLNPVSGAKHLLPRETRFVTRETSRERFVADVITSKCSPGSPEFFVVAFFLNRGVHWLAFCRIRDQSWTRIADIKHIHIRDKGIVIQPALALDDRNKLLYFFHLNPSASNYDLMVFDLKDSNDIKMKRLVMAEFSTVPREGFYRHPIRRVEPIITNFNIGDKSLFLVADSSCGDLFMVLQKNKVEGGSNVLPVESYRVFIKLNEGEPQWKEIHDLGDRSIFISHYNSRLISTAELNVGSKSEKELIEGNCIYFALQGTHRSLKRDIGVFSLTDRSIKHVPLRSIFQRCPIVTLWF